MDKDLVDKLTEFQDYLVMMEENCGYEDRCAWLTAHNILNTFEEKFGDLLEGEE